MSHGFRHGTRRHSNTAKTRASISCPLDSIRGLTEKAESSGAMMKMMNTTDHVMNFATPPYNWGCLPRCSGADTAADIPGEQGSH